MDENYVVYNRRYVILFILCSSLTSMFFELNEYASIGNVVTQYYDVSYTAVSWTSLVMNLETLVLFYPVGRFVERYGLRATLVTLTFVSIFGTLLKLLALNVNLFWLILCGQFFTGLTIQFGLCCFPLLAANWFKPKEAGFVFGLLNVTQVLGYSITFIPPRLLFNAQLQNGDIRSRLMWVNITVLLMSTLFCLLAVVFVVSKPSTPPSRAAERKHQTKENKSLITLLRNKNAVILMLFFGFLNCFIATSAITLNQSLMSTFGNKTTVLTIAGVLLTASGIPGSVIPGFVLHKFPKYKLLQSLCSILTLLFVVIFLTSLWFKNTALLFFSTFMFGFAVNFTVPVTIDFVVEVSFPFSEGLLMSAFNVCGVGPAIAVTSIMTTLMAQFGALNANFTFLALSAANVLISLFVSEDLRRTNTNGETAPLLQFEE